MMPSNARERDVHLLFDSKQPEKGATPNVTNADTNGSGHRDTFYGDDAFHHLPKPQQNILLLHGPRQKYSLHTTGQIPELRASREILVQVGIITIGLTAGVVLTLC